MRVFSRILLLKHKENEPISTISVTSREESCVDIPFPIANTMPYVPGALLPTNRLGMINPVLQRYGKLRADGISSDSTREIPKKIMSMSLA